MMTAIMKKHLGKKKGFTLIEVVVVLVILAILAAIAIPALVGYINDARERATMTEARTILVALQHMASTQDTDGKAYDIDGWVPTGGTDDGKDRISQLTGIATKNLGDIAITEMHGSSVDGFTYTKDGKTVTYDGVNFTVK